MFDPGLTTPLDKIYIQSDQKVSSKTVQHPLLFDGPCLMFDNKLSCDIPVISVAVHRWLYVSVFILFSQFIKYRCYLFSETDTFEISGCGFLGVQIIFMLPTLDAQTLVEITVDQVWKHTHTVFFRNIMIYKN